MSNAYDHLTKQFCTKNMWISSTDETNERKSSGVLRCLCQITIWFLLFSEDRKSFLVIKWVGFFLFCNKRTITSKITVRKAPVPIIDFVIRLYKLSWKMIIYKNLLSILLESNFWKRNISLKHTFYWVFVFLFYRPFIIYFYWTSFLVFTCNIPATLLTVFVWKSFHNHSCTCIYVLSY